MKYGTSKMDKQYIGTSDHYIISRGLLGALLGLQIPKVTALGTPEDTALPWLVEQGGKLYRWKTTTGTWIEVGTASTVSGGDILNILDNADLTGALDDKEDLITPGGADDYIAGDKTAQNFELKVYEFGDTRYLRLEDVEDAVLAIAEPKFVVDEPLYFETDSDGMPHLKVRFDSPTWNANKLMDIPLKAGAPTADNDVHTWNDGEGYIEWKAPL